MATPYRLVALLVSCIATSGCTTTYKPVVPTRIDGLEAHIEIVDAQTSSAWAAFNTKVTLKTWMPERTRLRQLMLVNARVEACTGAGMAATEIRLDDASADAGMKIDVSGEHRVRATFANAAGEFLNSPVALEWYDDVEGNKRCGRVELVAGTPNHAWTNESRWSIGAGMGGVGAFKAIGRVGGQLDFSMRGRYRLSERGALVGTLGFARAICADDACEPTQDDKGSEAQKLGVGLHLGVGYDYTLVHAGIFAAGIGPRYSPRLMTVPFRTGDDTLLIHELVAVPRLALAGPPRWASGLPGNSHGSSIDLEIPVGAWVGNQMRETGFVIGGMVTLNTAF